MSGQLWTDTEEEELRSLRAQRLTYHEIGKRLGRSSEACRMHARFGGILTRVISQTEDRTVYAPQESADPTAKEVWDAAEKRTSRDLAKARIQATALVQIMTDKPVALSISSDWHLRTKGACDLAGLREYGEAIRDTTGAYAIAVGDLLDNPIKWEKDVGEIPDDLSLLGHIFGTFGYKMLGTTDGNHDAWSRAFAGIDALKWLAEKERIHYAPDELVYIIELIDPTTQEQTARYVVATRHQYYRHSNLNPTHACFRWLEDRVGQWPVGSDDGELIPDILAIGHNHVACCEARTFTNKDIWGARMGAWQLTSEHGRRGGWRFSPPTAPTFILYPHRAQPIYGTAHYETALRMLAAERKAA